MWLSATHFFYVGIAPVEPQLSSTSQLLILFLLLLVNHLMGYDQVPLWLHKDYQLGYGNDLLACETLELVVTWHQCSQWLLLSVSLETHPALGRAGFALHGPWSGPPGFLLPGVPRAF